MPPWRNRISGYGEEAPDQLLANPANWRVHPKFQQDALAAILDEVGWVQDVIVNKTTGYVVDGHLRVALALSRGESSLPVKYVELSEEEEAKIIATLDPLSTLAIADADILAELLTKVATESAAVQTLIDETPGGSDGAGRGGLGEAGPTCEASSGHNIKSRTREHTGSDLSDSV